MIPTRLRTVGHVLVTIVFVAVILLTIVIAVPGILGADETYVVRSGSMAPSINAGDVVVVKSVTATNIDRGDIVTYQRASKDTAGQNTKRITHRVVAINRTADGLRFYTKGDANEERDSQPVAPSQIIGGVWFHIPLVGWVVAFTNTTIGRILLLVVPGLLLVINEVYTLFAEDSDLQ